MTGFLIKCDVCQKPIEQGQSWIHHSRLNANVHLGCPKTNVKGEDITGHTVFWHEASK